MPYWMDKLKIWFLLKKYEAKQSPTYDSEAREEETTNVFEPRETCSVSCASCNLRKKRKMEWNEHKNQFSTYYKMKFEESSF